MRATRATELADIYPSHACAGWLGRSRATADQFYRSITDEHFRKAAGVSGRPGMAEQLPSRTAMPQRKLQPSATPAAAQGCQRHFSYQKNARNLEPSAIPAAAQQGNTIARMQSGNTQAQQNPQHQMALLGDVERNGEKSTQPQVTSVSLLSTACNLVYHCPVGPAGLEPATKGL
jgi:hypothetical protein